MLIVLLSFSIISFAENDNYQFIFQDKDGRYYLTEDTVIELANYIKKLQDLNTNYLAQINNLKQQIANLEKQILNLEEQVKILEDENNKLKKELEQERTRKLIWTVVATIFIGSTIILFLK